jgi:large subunit ribosomal protein L5
MSRLKEKYQKEVVPALKKEFGYANVDGDPEGQQGRDQHGPRRGDSNAKIVDTAADELSKITGRRPPCAAPRSRFAAFKVRRACRSAPW